MGLTWWWTLIHGTDFCLSGVPHTVISGPLWPDTRALACPLSCAAGHGARWPVSPQAPVGNCTHKHHALRVRHTGQIKLTDNTNFKNYTKYLQYHNVTITLQGFQCNISSTIITNDTCKYCFRIYFLTQCILIIHIFICTLKKETVRTWLAKGTWFLAPEFHPPSPMVVTISLGLIICTAQRQITTSGFCRHTLMSHDKINHCKKLYKNNIFPSLSLLYVALLDLEQWWFLP